MAEKQLIVAIEGTAAMGPFWNSMLTEYLDKIIRWLCGSEGTGQKLSGASVELALVVFNAHGPYSACLVQRSGWTRDMDVFLQWLAAIPFTGGGFSEVAIAEGIAEALMMFSITSNGNQTQPSVDWQKHCILVAASNPYSLPTPVSRPSVQKMEQSDSAEVQSESRLSDAETVAKSFSQCCVSLSVISPKQLPKLRTIYSAGKRNPRAADPAVDNAKNPQFLVLISENFMEARAALNRPGITNLAANQSPLKLDTAPVPPISGSAPTSIPSVNGSMMNRQPIPAGNIPTATVKVEPITVASMVSGPPFSHLTSHGASQGVPSLQFSSPSPTSQEMITSGDSVQEFKPMVNGMPQPLRPAVPAAANVSILNNLSQAQARQVISSASLAGGSSMGLQTMGGMTMHMISSGMSSSALPAAQTVLSSGQSGIASITGSGAIVGPGQVTQNTGLGSFTSATSTMSGNSNLGMSPPLGNLQGAVSMAQSVSGMGQGNLTSGAQLGQSGVGINQNIMNNLGPSGMPSGAGTMIPTPGMSQPVQVGLPSLGVNNGSAASMTLPQHASGPMQSQSKYLKVWEGALSGQRQGQPVFICRLEGYRNASASETLAADWPPTMQIVRLISQDHMNNKQYVGKADFLVFRALNHHGFLGQLQEKKLCAVIQLTSQTLLLSVSDKASRLIGMLFPGDMVVFKPQISSQQQQLQQQQLQQQQQQQLQQHQQQQPQQLPQQQMVGAGMNQTFVQGPGRSQIMSQGQVPSQGPPSMPGSGFLS
eukprot:TRINITY_DN18530_c0_g1_i1.p1 TRINITY_DN18530_c0_g1~~TRINITY_DN18530_c0_g1_i1.p1  ORF type:complete len:765 (+),score=185.35 TRINITY_DN18530_c0_g1_i1:296-2590(+)